MKFGREKRTILGWAALLAPIPLPFNEVLEWPVLLIYELAIVYYLQRVDSGHDRWLPNWALNLLGLVFIPLFAIDLRLAVGSGSPVKALLHLLLFLLVVKLYSIREERHKWHCTVLIFFVFLGAMATSSHVSISLYLVASAIVGGSLLNRFVALHVARDAAVLEAPQLKKQGLWPVGLATVLLAVPLFAMLPRLREPIVLGRGGSVGAVRATGFSDSVDLNLTTSIRANREVAMRVKFSEPVDNGENLRFKAATYETYRNTSWVRALDRSSVLQRNADRIFEISETPSASTAEIYLEPLASSSLVLPSQTTGVDVGVGRLMLDPGGAVVLPGLPPTTIRYEASLAGQAVIEAQLEDLTKQPAALDTKGLSERIVALGVEVMGSGSPEDQLDRLVRHLLTSYTYTLDFVGRDGEKPLEDFLFEHRSGHCEYFASSMVLLARTKGIPARLVTGFLGAEYNPLEGYFIVRQQNAHAWVEAYSPERGWRIYDPTPPDGRPLVAERSLGMVLAQVYDFLTFRWDRYVLTYGADDQEGFLRRLRDRVSEWWTRLTEGRSSDPAPAANDQPGVVEGPLPATPMRPVDGPLKWLTLVVLLGTASAAVWIVNRRRWYPSRAGSAYLRVRSLLERRELEIDAALAPLGLVRLVEVSQPAALPAVSTIVDLYLRESFDRRPITSDERELIWRSLRTLKQLLAR